MQALLERYRGGRRGRRLRVRELLEAPRRGLGRLGDVAAPLVQVEARQGVERAGVAHRVQVRAETRRARGRAGVALRAVLLGDEPEALDHLAGRGIGVGLLEARLEGVGHGPSTASS